MDDLSVCASVGASVCPVHCGKNGGSDPDAAFSIIGRTGPGMRQVGFEDWSMGRGTFGANLGRATVTNGDFTA